MLNSTLIGTWSNSEGIPVPDLLEAAFFPVDLRPLYLEISSGTNQRYRRLPRHQAVMDVEKDRVFAVVTDDYRLVTNREAYQMADRVMSEVFKVTKKSDLACINTIMPSTRSFCHLDLADRVKRFVPFDNDPWMSFLRVTNSYNRTKLLKFELGFCRDICKNGVIFGSKSIEFSYAHTQGDTRRVERFEDNIGDIQALEASFTQSLQQLQRYHVPKQEMLGVLCRVFDIQVSPEVGIKGKKLSDLLGLREHVRATTEHYFESMGHHAYAAFNVLTDFATRPQTGRAPETLINGYQQRVGNWVDAFIKAIEDRQFSFDAYLAEVRGTVEALNALRAPGRDLFPQE